MNRRWLIVVLALACVGASAGAQEPQAGRDFTVVVPPQPTNDPQHIVVTEFFSYACQHCFRFNPSLTIWVSKLPKDVVFERVAVVFGRQVWAAPAKIFYALQTLGKVEQLSPDVFGAIHVEHKDFQIDKDIFDWMGAHGVEREKFAAAYNAFSMKASLARGDQLAQTYRLPGVPALVVDGKYMLAISDNGDYGAQLATLDRLVEMARKSKAH
jgi:thiol:disulfide interchange protein DsbA